jgi:tRNA threonylcarbamoyladenosine biosynthesis protein TsaE
VSRDRSLVSRSPDETRRLGALLGELLEGGDVVSISGELGAGKTCLVQGIARGLGVDPSVPITSPTFTLVGEYPGRLALRHADFYRVESYARLDDAGFQDLFDESGVLVVEWPELFPEALPQERFAIAIELVSECERRVRFGGVGRRAAQIERRILERWR